MLYYLGECFVDMSDELKEVYGHYCRNHDEVNCVIDKVRNFCEITFS